MAATIEGEDEFPEAPENMEEEAFNKAVTESSDDSGGFDEEEEEDDE